MTSPSRSCSLCAHSLACYGRLTLVELIQDFKVISISQAESANTGCTHSATDLLDTLAGACVLFVREGDLGVSRTLMIPPRDIPVALADSGRDSLNAAAVPRSPRGSLSPSPTASTT